MKKTCDTKKLILLAALVPGIVGAASSILAPFTPVLDGAIDGGYSHLTEDPAAEPALGGSAVNSDFIGETASNHWTDRSSGTTYEVGSNRGDIQQFYVSTDSNNLYIGLSGPQIGHNNWTGPGAGSTQTNGDQGDIWIAIDVANSPSGSLAATSTPNFSGGSGVRAVDFTGWTPTHFVGVQYVDNGGGGGGGAGFTAAGVGVTITTENQNLSNGGFDWFNAGGDSYEFAIPWASLGLVGMPTSGAMRFAAYTTQNFGGSDVYDSGPGFGNGGPFEQIGDYVGDADVGLAGSGVDDDDDGITPGSGPGNPGTQPGANYVDPSGYNGPSNLDEYDTIGEYWEVKFVPEPSSALLSMLGLFGLLLRRRR